MVRRYAVVALLAAAATGAVASAQQGFMPASFQSGPIPDVSPNSISAGGGQVLIEVTVASDGSVIGSRPLRTTPFFTERIQSTSSGWRFAPAEAMIEPRDRRPGGPLTHPIESKVLVAGVFRPPQMFGASMGDTITDVGNPSDEIPFPLTVIEPTYPVNSVGVGVVLVEARVNTSGAVIGAAVKLSSPGFDAVALNAAKQWQFRPARVGGAFVPSLAYIVFTFSVPMTYFPPKGAPPGTPSIPPGN